MYSIDVSECTCNLASVFSSADPPLTAPDTASSVSVHDFGSALPGAFSGALDF